MCAPAGQQLCELWNLRPVQTFYNLQHGATHKSVQGLEKGEQLVVERSGVCGSTLSCHVSESCNMTRTRDKQSASGHAVSQSVAWQISPFPLYAVASPFRSPSPYCSGTLGQTTNDFAVDSCLLPFGEFSVNYGCNKLYNISRHTNAFMRTHLVPTHTDSYIGLLVGCFGAPNFNFNEHWKLQQWATDGAIPFGQHHL